MNQSVMTEQTHGPTPAHLLFEDITADELTRDDLVRLAAGVRSSIKVKGFFSASECTAIMDAVNTCQMGSYDEQLVRPRIPKLGPAAFDHYQTGGFDETYWEHAHQSATTRATLLHGTDPLDIAVARIKKAWDNSVRPLTTAGRPMFAGMIREMTNGAGIHFDELVREFPEGADDTPVVQLAFNCHLSMPDAGGELQVFRRHWEPGDEPLRGANYWYPEEIIAGENYATVLADVGDAVFFDPRNYHRILPRRGEGRRVTFSFFLGLTGSGELVYWS
jgi:hypothetical protein